MFGLDNAPRARLTCRWGQEKVLGARRAGANKVIVPWANRKDVEHDVPKEVRARMQFVFARTVREALDAALAKGRCRGARSRRSSRAGYKLDASFACAYTRCHFQCYPPAPIAFLIVCVTVARSCALLSQLHRSSFLTLSTYAFPYDALMGENNVIFLFDTVPVNESHMSMPLRGMWAVQTLWSIGVQLRNIVLSIEGFVGLRRQGK
jgi:hypothetical protein